ncbi:phage holin family protein [Microlunatus flavus]|uniref:Putative Holin-X, holin superfamily III n=1 Tax=Microlunatus flavus TaxID=1036181 RepID=A0A1H9A4P5_9ACTN|nr:phage holin family protein [Microlunatus flavus]SEP71463.1 Putative Holin-X, holin superfamily III [Microlunatus flavus]
MPQESEEERRSLGQVLGDVSKDLSTLVRQELTLAKAEASQSASRAGKGVGMFAGAAVAGLLLLVFVSVSAWWGLGQFIGNQWSALVVALVWLIVAVVLALAGKKELARVKGLPQTADTVGKIPNALKGQEERNR